MSKKTTDKGKLWEIYRNGWLHAPEGSEKEKFYLEKITELLRPQFVAAKTEVEIWAVFLKTMYASPFEEEVWQKWNAVNKIEKAKRGES
jgi:hypothetical protein